MLNIAILDHIDHKQMAKLKGSGKFSELECILCQRTTLTKNDLIAELNGFMYRYNYQRRHGSLNYQTPLEKLKQVANLLPKC
jgi:transposase InsO family protein